MNVDLLGTALRPWWWGVSGGRHCPQLQREPPRGTPPGSPYMQGPIPSPDAPLLALLGVPFLHGSEAVHTGDTTASPTSSRDSNTGQEPPLQGTGALSTRSGAAYLGMGCDVGTTGTNLGQLAICSWTFMQEETCTRILASVT